MRTQGSVCTLQGQTLIADSHPSVCILFAGGLRAAIPAVNVNLSEPACNMIVLRPWLSQPFDVLDADICNFTPLSSSMATAEVFLLLRWAPASAAAAQPAHACSATALHMQAQQQRAQCNRPDCCCAGTISQLPCPAATSSPCSTSSQTATESTRSRPLGTATWPVQVGLPCHWLAAVTCGYPGHLGFLMLLPPLWAFKASFQMVCT